MPVFGDYAVFYDALYQDKDYSAECDFVEVLWRRFSAGPIQRVLDMGCGTGGHALPLASRGYAVTGVDRSAEMLAVARQKSQQAGQAVRWLEGDVRHVDTGEAYDAVLFLFAVLGYQTTNADLSAALGTARRHLRPGGVLVFDVWFGPAVLADRPTDRIKHTALGETRLIRLAQPTIDLLAQQVVVQYSVLQLAGDRVLRQVSEAHAMRFFFPQELVFFLEQTGFRMLHMCPFLRSNEPMTERDFNLTVVAQAA